MNSFPYRIRPIQAEKDAAGIAKLIKRCFRPWLEYDNIEYLDQLCQAGEQAEKHSFLTKLTGFPYNLFGIVCTNNSGEILGVVNTNVFFRGSYKCCLISNVCVDPDHRKEGIASHMLEEAERCQKTDGCYGLFLQMRMENPGTFHFYKHNGFSTTDFRQTWIFPVRKQRNIDSPSAYKSEPVPESDRVSFQCQFQSRYPDSILWNLDYPAELFRFGRAGDFYNRLTSPVNRFCRIVDNSGGVKAWAAFQDLRNNVVQLWFIPNGEISDEELSECLHLLCMEFKGDKCLKLDIPAGSSAEIFEKSGFARLHTLAWMWKRL